MQFLPIPGWWVFGDGSAAKLWAYATALSGNEPAMPPVVGLLSHHLQGTMHSAFVAGTVTSALWLVLRSL